ncbi:MAG: hypothetical protein LCH38_06175 [Proteobacteria bacterium]|nr:hypothetical protein [Pseudomonadota bacterium]
MRVFVLALTFAFIALPALLILFAPQRRLVSRAVWAVLAILAPFLTIGPVQLLPRMTNNAADATQWERFFGLLLSGSGFVLPWVIFAVFLHAGRRRERM